MVRGAHPTVFRLPDAFRQPENDLPKM